MANCTLRWKFNRMEIQFGCRRRVHNFSSIQQQRRSVMIKPSNQTVNTPLLHVQAHCTWCGSVMFEKIVCGVCHEGNCILSQRCKAAKLQSMGGNWANAFLYSVNLFSAQEIWVVIKPCHLVSSSHKSSPLFHCLFNLGPAAHISGKVHPHHITAETGNSGWGWPQTGQITG